MRRCTHPADQPCPACETRIAEREAWLDEGEPMTDGDWDELEAGRFWNSYPGMGAA